MKSRATSEVVDHVHSGLYKPTGYRSSIIVFISLVQALNLSESMDLRLAVCVVAVFIVVEADSPSEARCRKYCQYGFVPGRFCECRRRPGEQGGYRPRESPCALRYCGPRSRCIERYGRAQCVPRFPIYPPRPSGGSNNRACYLPMVIGRCRAAIPRYYYNRNSRRCVRFRYGGCGGNANNFQTLRQCRRTCERRQSRRPRGRD